MTNIQLEQDTLISVIVPVYNVEKYLRECLDSIIHQTYKKLEIILIDDGSTDLSSSICDEYARRDSRIIVIHKPNGGLSSARNAGLKIATGELIGFVDSDDYIELTMYEKLKNNMDKFNSDLAICSFYKQFRYISYSTKKQSHEEMFEEKEKFDNLDIIASMAWNKLYKKYIFDSINYPEGKIFEDIYIICDVLDAANRVSYIYEPLYHYRMRLSSICRTYTDNHKERIDSINNRIISFNKHSYEDLRVKEEYKKIMESITYSCKIKAVSLDDTRISGYIQDAVKISKVLKDSDYLSSKEKKNLDSFLQDKDKFYRNYKFQFQIKDYLKKVSCYK